MKLFDRGDWRMYDPDTEPEGQMFAATWALFSLLGVCGVFLWALAPEDEDDVRIVGAAVAILCALLVVCAAISDYRDAR
jgi:drug/metabolite transporter (DMT)-like permease